MKRTLILSCQPALFLAFLCLIFFTARDSGFVNWTKQLQPQTAHIKQGQSTISEPRFYIELSEPDEFPVTLRLNDAQGLKRVALLYRLEKLRNGDRIVFNDGAISLSRISGQKSMTLGIPIGINSADIEGLTALPGIGPRLAERIVKYRSSNGPFKTIDDMRNVDGIGEKKIEAIRPFINLD